MYNTASIIDQWLCKTQEEIRERIIEDFGNDFSDSNRLRSIAFLYLCIQTKFNFDQDTILEMITDGSGDFGVDAIYIEDPDDRVFNICLFQAKYHSDLSGTKEFSENEIRKLISAVGTLFVRQKNIAHINARLRAKVEEIRSIIAEGNIPKITIVCCSNGKKWGQSAQEIIDNSDHSAQLRWEHFNHDDILDILQSGKPVNATLRLTGKSFIDDFSGLRVIIGRLAVSEIAKLMTAHGEKLLERNIRQYLDLKGNRVNEDIMKTIESPEESKNFYFYNNGLTIVCEKFARDGLQSEDTTVTLDSMKIVNGGQTSMTIMRVNKELNDKGQSLPLDASVLVRIYELDQTHDDIITRITYATNSQNPVALKELKSNDAIQKNLAKSIEGFGYNYVLKNSEKRLTAKDLTIGNAAEAILAIWREKPNKAKFSNSEHFGKYYDEIFSKELNGAQVVTAVLLYRIAERHRRQREVSPEFIRYASCYIAMMMGKSLLKDLNCNLAQLNHRNFPKAETLINDQGESYFLKAVEVINYCCNEKYKNFETMSLQQLSARFRSADLISELNNQSLDLQE